MKAEWRLLGEEQRVRRGAEKGGGGSTEILRRKPIALYANLKIIQNVCNQVYLLLLLN